MRGHEIDDQDFLQRLAGRETYLRGLGYARDGAVLEASWNLARTLAYGRVAGSRREVYRVTAVMSRRPDGSLATFTGNCSCPMTLNCKHAVALVLADEPRPRGAVTVLRPAWQRQLEAFAALGDVGDDAASIGIQFEVVAASGVPTSVVLRPVLRGTSGKWVRTGISWTNLVTIRHSNPEQYRLLNEMAVLHNAALTQSYYYRYGPLRVTLETFPSRRIWDLVDEARAAGIALVRTGAAAAPVSVHTASATLAFDLVDSDGGVQVAPLVTLGDERLAHGDTLPLGTPVHGLAWLDAGQLRLARLAAPPGLDVRELLQGAPTTVPGGAREQLFAEHVPRLLRIAPVVSSDGSVEVPAQSPPVLTLQVRHAGGHRAELDWSWTYAVGSATRSEPLRPESPRDAAGRDLATEHRIARFAAAKLLALPELLDTEGELVPSRELGGMATVRLVSEILPKLAEVDGVEVVVIGEAPEYRPAQDVPVITFSGEPEAGDWFDLSVQVAADGQHVPFVMLFEALARGEQTLIMPNGVYFSLERPEFVQLALLIAESRALLDAPPGVMRVGRLQISVWEELEGIGAVTAQADAWRGATRALADLETIEEHPVPSGLDAELRPYQRDGFQWLAFLYEHGLGGLLADEMGLGKTVQTLALLCHVFEKGLTHTPFLVVAPTGLVHNWAAECQRFAPGLTVRTVTETGRRRQDELATIAAGANLVVTSYTLFRLEYEEYAAIPWAGLVLDEAQFVKNHKSLAYRAVKRLPTPFKLAVTGTPLENNLMELWSLLSIAAAGLFPNAGGFEEFFRIPIERGHNDERLGQLRARVKPLMLRRTKSQVIAELPDKDEQIVELDLNPKHRKVYQTHLQRERQKVLGMLESVDKNRFAIFRSLTLLRQACLDASLVDPSHAHVPSTKLDDLLDRLTEVAAEGHRAVVFSQFTRFLDTARRRLDAAGIASCYLDGSTRRRGAVIEEFKSGAAPVFLISLKAGGFGLNLTEADYCFLLDPWWNPATEAQAVDRLHRIGQTRKVMVYRLVARDTIEQKVMALKAGKAALFDSVTASGGVTSGRLTAADIRGLIA